VAVAGGAGEKTYCICGKSDADDDTMIGCDAPNCPHEWYHLKCMELTEPPPEHEKWYCPFCRPKMLERQAPKKKGARQGGAGMGGFAGFQSGR
jgi:hypothetical protein